MITIRKFLIFPKTNKKIWTALLVVLLMLYWNYHVGLQQNDYLVLEDILEVKLDKNKIFFIETSGIVGQKYGKLKNRQACAIESAAITNPDAHIYIVFAEVLTLEASEWIVLLKKLANVFFLRLDLISFSKDSPVEKFISSGKIKESNWPVEHLSDLLRLLILWR